MPLPSSPPKLSTSHCPGGTLRPIIRPLVASFRVAVHTQEGRVLWRELPRAEPGCGCYGNPGPRRLWGHQVTPVMPLPAAQAHGCSCSPLGMQAGVGLRPRVPGHSYPCQKWHSPRGVPGLAALAASPSSPSHWPMPGPPERPCCTLTASRSRRHRGHFWSTPPGGRGGLARGFVRQKGVR